MKLKTISILFALAISMVSCRESDRNNEDQTTSSYEFARAENAFYDVWKTVHSTILKDTVLGGADTTLPPDVCVDSIRRYPDIGYPVQLIIYFSPKGSVCSDGRTRTGNIVASLTGPYTDSNSLLTITFDDYFSDDLELSGEMTIQNLGDSALLPVYRKTITEAWLVREAPGNNRQETYFNSQESVVWGEGADTPNEPADDEFRANGFASGRNTFGVFFEATITDQITTRLECLYDNTGKVTIEQENLADRYLDYESGCDGKLSVSFYNTTEYITIP